ncbi:MATE family efflux transporter [Coprobacillus sp. K06]|uniref:MATE family efflux transporter n=2 Tax=Coprobacillaceae TaxID=2810280 RepID=UPI001C8BABE5|nr:MATE family efflux transporter [Coprobacillus sp. K06]MBX9164547.1 MATE family efflux transporter [Coprobacillus sp. K06]
MNKDLTKGPVVKSMLLFAIPMILGDLLQQCYNIADTLIVGQFLGKTALAAVGSSFTLMTFITSIILGLCMGSGALFSIRFGQRDKQGLKQDLCASFFFIAFISILLNIIAYICLDALKLFLRVPHEVWGDMKCYLLYIFMGIIAIFLYNFFSAYLRSIGNSVTPLIFLAISSILNIILDLYFVLVLKMGVGGAALATVLSQYVSGIGIVLYTLLKYKEVLVIFKISYLKRERIKQIISFSLLTCIQQSVMNLGILMVQGLVNSFGTVVMAAFAAAVKIDAFAYMPVQDFGNAFSTFIAQNYGAKEKERIQKGLKEAVRISSIFCIVISILVYIFAKPLMMIFVDAKETSIILEGVRYLRIEGAFYIGIGCLFLLYGLYRALGRPGMSVVLTVFSLGTRVALAYILSSIPALGVTGIWWSVPIGWALADIVGLVYYKKNKHNLLSFGGVL